MNTPICDFVRDYTKSGTSRLHMPGHKGRAFLGCEPLDLTEIAGADELYAPDGIIADSEANASSLFGTAHTFYSTEGSSQCIRSMLFLAMQNASGSGRPRILAARNVHRSFLTAAALLDLDVSWLWPETERRSLCACPISPACLDAALCGQDESPAAVYVTSPDYLGNRLDLAGLASVCHAHDLPLLVDNAHGAYLHFLTPPEHPIDLGADACCDSAHKTLPVLTGGAYLQISAGAPKSFLMNARQALALFGSTSPSYLILQSLDRANAYLADGYPEALRACAERVESLRVSLCGRGWQFPAVDPLRLTLAAGAEGGRALADRLRRGNMECEYADPDYVVLMFTPENPEEDYARVWSALSGGPETPFSRPVPLFFPPRVAMGIRTALFAPHETLPVREAFGRVCGAPTASCPPAVPVVCCGEVIGEAEMRLLLHYGIEQIEVVR